MPVLIFWNGTVKGLRPVVRNNKFALIENVHLDHCLTCFGTSDYYLLFYDEPSDEIINTCKNCTKEILKNIKEGNEIFTKEQRDIWFKVRMGIGLSKEEIKIYKKCCK